MAQALRSGTHREALRAFENLMRKHFGIRFGIQSQRPAGNLQHGLFFFRAFCHLAENTLLDAFLSPRLD